MKTETFIVLPPERVTCTKCHGQGFVYLVNDTDECDKCEGAGYVIKKGNK